MKIHLFSNDCWFYDFEDTLDGKRSKMKYFSDFYNSTLKTPEKTSFFDYTTCLIHSATKQVDDDNLKKIYETLQKEFNDIPENGKLDWIIRNTSMSHEMRHFHDSVGTSAGLIRYELIFRDIVLFFIQIFKLKLKKKKKQIELPINLIKDFLNKFENEDWEEYLNAHFNNVINLSIFDASYFLPISKGTTISKNRLIGFYSEGNGDFNLEEYKKILLKFNFPKNLIENFPHETTLFFPFIPLVLFPDETQNVGLGYRVMTESNAWVCQYFMISDLYGTRYANEIKQIFQKRNPHSHPYMAIDLLIGKYHKPYYMDLCTYYVDKTLNSENLFSTNIISNPGWIFLQLLKSDEIKEHTETRSYHNDLFSNEILIHQEAIQNFKSLIENIKQTATEFNSRILDVVSKVGFEIIQKAERMSEVRKTYPDILSNPITYLSNVDTLPPPLFIAYPKDNDEYQMINTFNPNNITQKEINLWLFIINMVATVLLKDEFKCPLKGLKIICESKSSDCELDFNKKCFYKEFLTFI